MSGPNVKPSVTRCQRHKRATTSHRRIHVGKVSSSENVSARAFENISMRRHSGVASIFEHCMQMWDKSINHGDGYDGNSRSW